ncbi:Vesicle transport protein SFT2B [Thelohanellus kitauei]|uniref:Vesicle transport protein n=1 Tax=Thelohanellus kitauei TaxID=669202 RepID=A0A0C2MAN6_THEKT|nr:Vesicle transport protein SFT2B [Thelohanellus kitauei]
MSAFKQALGLESQEDTGATGFGLIDRMQLSWETRIKGFAVCASISLVISLTGAIVMFIAGSTAFVILYTIGTVFSLLSTFFLMGPMRQLKGAFEAKRRIATVVLIASIVVTLIFGILGLSILALICCLGQFLAFIWYSLSYIPGARDVVGGCLSSTFGF